MDPTTALGLVAAFLTSIAFVPQVWRNYRRRNVEDLSLSTFGTFSVGVVFWLLYGLSIDSLPIIVANVFTLTVCLVILGQMWFYRRKPSA